MKWIAIILFSLVLAGCMPKRDMSREDWLQMSTRTFPNTTTEQVYKTSETVLRLSDPSDVMFSHTEDKMLGQRRFMIYSILSATVGKYDFDFTARQDGKGVVAKVNIYGEMQNMLGPVIRYHYQWREAYDAYFDRMEALLYGKPWRICQELEGAAEASAMLEPLCFLADDTIPENAKLSEQSALIIQQRKQVEADAEKLKSRM